MTGLAGRLGSDASELVIIGYLIQVSKVGQ